MTVKTGHKISILVLVALLVVIAAYLIACFAIPSSARDPYTARATVLLGAITLLLAFVAAFQDFIRGWFLKPELSLEMEMDAPYCTKIPSLLPSISKRGGYEERDVYYFRFRVKNSGNIDAKNG
jgi:hypothetical protein